MQEYGLRFHLENGLAGLELKSATCSVVSFPFTLYPRADRREDTGEKDVVDRVYKAALPKFRKALEELRAGFSSLEPSKTDWVELRVDPLLKHLDSLEGSLHSMESSPESSRLRRGVALFHSDLVYLRENVRGLRMLLESLGGSVKGGRLESRRRPIAREARPV